MRSTGRGPICNLFQARGTARSIIRHFRHAAFALLSIYEVEREGLLVACKQLHVLREKERTFARQGRGARRRQIEKGPTAKTGGWTLVGAPLREGGEFL